MSEYPRSLTQNQPNGENDSIHSDLDRLNAFTLYVENTI